ncbi:MAG TPA: hypothetical protein VIT91_06875 [Chthoniobacterales bacterium]
MIGAPTFRDHVESCRPPGAPPRETKALFLTASRFRDRLADCLDDIESDALLLNEDELDELAIALTELAEDLHCDAGLWRSIETYHREFFGVSLPLLCKSGEAGAFCPSARGTQAWRPRGAHSRASRLASVEIQRPRPLLLGRRR